MSHNPKNAVVALLSTRLAAVSLCQLLVFVALVACGAAARVTLSELPNFAPVAAIALFAGYFFRSRQLAMLVPLLVMVISDCFLGFYHWPMMLLVYGALLLPVLASRWLRCWLTIDGSRGTLRSTAGLMGCSLGASLSFFLITNLGTWLWFDLYDASWTGLLQCYVQAIPFFRNTLSGDLVFAVVLFGGYALARSWQLRTSHEASPAKCEG